MKPIFPLLLLCLLLPLGVRGQATPMESVASVSAEVTKKVQRFEFSLEEELRLRMASPAFKFISTNVQVDYSILPKHLKAGLLYTYRRRLNDDGYYSNHNRVGAQVVGKYTFITSGIYLSLRARYQATFRQEYDNTLYKVNPTQYLRTRLEVGYAYRGSRWEYAASAEPFFYLNGGIWNGLTVMRYEVEASYRLDRPSTIGALLRFDQSIYEKNPMHRLMIGAKYKFRL